MSRIQSVLLNLRLDGSQLRDGRRGPFVDSGQAPSRPTGPIQLQRTELIDKLETPDPPDIPKGVYEYCRDFFVS
jgi:hypothetical protein